MLRSFLTFFFFAKISIWLFSQNTPATAPNFWTKTAPEAVLLPAGSVKEFEPLRSESFRLDLAALKQNLLAAPLEFSAGQTPVFVLLPLADGSFEPFTVCESAIMMPGLQAKFPEIRTFSGESQVRKGLKMRCTLTHIGFSATIYDSGVGIQYVEPIAKGQTEWYRAYRHDDFPAASRPDPKLGIDVSNLKKQAHLLPSPSERFAPEFEMEERGTLLGPVSLRIYRFALACNGEFAQDHGGTLALVMSALVNYTNTMNVVYEAELNVRLKLIDEEDKIIFLNSATDPYSGSTVQDWMGQNPAAMEAAIGPNANAKFDIGHVFARFINTPNASAIGVAGGLCCTDSKARGCSAGNTPYGAGFLVIPGQEIGHQWAGGHTWNHCLNNLQYSENSACEPGAGSTIMSYGGSCGSDNVSAGTDLYYHACSIAEIRGFIESGVGNTCGETMATTNNMPMVTIPIPNNTFIPFKTPFELNGSAVDPDGDTGLTYNWDEIDLGPPTPLGSPIGTSPLFRSYPPTAATNRIFPKSQFLVTNQATNVELLPTYTRDLNFRLVARDNKAGAGGVGWADLTLKATELAGPFLVTGPNTNSVIWKKGEDVLVTWDVANTDKAPVNCQKVNIRLSRDAGYNFDFTLASDVPNTGAACVRVPDNINTTSLARVRVEAADNVFFDISNVNFKIENPVAPGFSICSDDVVKQICTPETWSTEISTTAFLGFTGDVALSLENLPANASAVLEPAIVSVGNPATLTVTMPADVAKGTYTVTVRGVADSVSATRDIIFTVVNTDFSAIALTAPADGAAGVLQTPALTWSVAADADLYEVQVASSPSFAAGTIVASKLNATSGTWTPNVTLEKGKIYFWRVRPVNACGAGAWVGPFSFATLLESCNVAEAQDLPKNISASSTPTVESKLTIIGGGTVSDVNIHKLKGSHQSFVDLDVRLVAPDGTEAIIWQSKCGVNSYAFDFQVDDAATGANFPCPPPNNGTTLVKPANPFSVFNGKDAAGTWILRVKDNVISGGGQVSAFQLELCSSSAPNPPYIVNNNALTIWPGSNAQIGNALLKAEDANNTADQLTFTLVTKPAYGHLHKDGVGELAEGAQFKQSDLDNGFVRYYDYGFNSTGMDNFRFVVTDGEGGLVAGKYTILLDPTGTSELAARPDFSLAPNPAAEKALLSFAFAPVSETQVRVFDAAGRLLQNHRMAAGTASLWLDLANLPQGVYLVSVENSLGTAGRKLVRR